MLHQLPSNQRLARFAKKCFRVTTSSVNIREQGVKQRKPSDFVLDLDNVVEEEGEDGEKLKEELSAFNIFWWIQKWKTEDRR